MVAPTASPGTCWTPRGQTLCKDSVGGSLGTWAPGPVWARTCGHSSAGLWDSEAPPEELTIYVTL